MNSTSVGLRESKRKTFNVECDEEHDEPFITIRPGVRLTPYWREDADGRVSMIMPKKRPQSHTLP